jgi:methyl-accepting chemotaxis protein
MKKLNTKSISFRLVIGGCLAVILPLIVVGYLAITKSSEALLTISKSGLCS